jgi:Family of unknown function (DUF5681)
MLDDDRLNSSGQDESATKVGYRHPPVHSRFKPGQSGNPSGRRKGSKNIRTLFQEIMKEQVSLREGAHVRSVTKREAILRGLVVSAMKGDSKSMMMLLRLAEQTGELVEGGSSPNEVRVVIVD